MVGFRLEEMTGSIIASIQKELLYRYLVFALCVILCNNQIRTKSQKFLCYLILSLPYDFNALSSRSEYTL